MRELAGAGTDAVCYQQEGVGRGYERYGEDGTRSWHRAGWDTC